MKRKKKPFKNLQIKLIALFLAIILEWNLYSPDNLKTSDVSFLISIASQPSGMMAISPPGAEKGLLARARVRGPEPVIEQLKSRSLELKVDVPTEVESNYLVEFDPTSLRLPPGVEVIEIVPDVVEYKFDTVLKKELRVELDRDGEVNEDYILKRIDISPKGIFAQGPKGELSGISTIKTKQFDMSKATPNKSFEMPLQRIGALTSLGLNVVTVQFILEDVQDKIKFEKIPVTVSASEGFAATISPGSLDIVVTGPKRLLKSLNHNEIEMFVDARDLALGQHRVTPRTNLPEDLQISFAKQDPIELILVNKN